MNFDSRKRKSWKNDSAVSEIVGNILILMITVTLFSSIIAFVQQMPVPEQQTKADFSGTISFGPGGTTANLTLTHAGGAKMLKKDVLVLVSVDSHSTAYYFVNDTDFHSEVWSMGIAWTKQLTGTQYTSKVDVTIVDISKSNMIWSSQISGGAGNNPPMILERYVDSNPSTPTPDPVLEHDNFSLFVKIVDPDNDLDRTKVWIDSTQIEGAGHSVRHWDAEPSPGVFQWLFNTWTPVDLSASALDGAVIMIHARDLALHESSSAFVMTVTILPVRPVISSSDQGEGGEGGLPVWLSNKSGRHGYGVYGENKSGGIARGYANVNDKRTSFQKDEMVFIRVASLDMNDINLLNVVEVEDERTGYLYTPSYVMNSKVTAPFYTHSSGGNVFIYECKFNTTDLPPGIYAVRMILLRGDGQFLFNTSFPLRVYQPGFPMFEPAVWLFKASDRTQLWGTKTSPFEVSGGTFKIYGSIKVFDTQASPAPSVEGVRIQDFSGTAQVYGKPVSGNMLPAWTPAGNGTAYNFEIDLRYSNGAKWLGGTNSYALQITKMSDANEGLYSLVAQVYVKSYSAHADFFVGTSGIAVGHANFDTKAYLLYIENNNFFTMNPLWSYTNTPSDRNTYTTTAVGLGDISGDGYKDVLIGQDNSNELLYFRNSLDTYGRWQEGSSIARPAADAANNIRWIAFGDVNGDDATDFAYVSTANKIVIYNNTYGIQGRVFLDYGATVVRKIDLKDMNGDDKADLIVLAGGKIYVHNIANWGIGTTLMTRMPDSANAWAGGTGIQDFDIADMNGDGNLDILTVGDAGTIAGTNDLRGVWINRYMDSATPTTRLLDQTATYYDIRIAAGTKVSGGDVQDTWAVSGSALQFAENMTTTPTGRVNVTMRFQTLDNTDNVQRLVVRARLLEGFEEPFYAWFSLDTDGNSNKFVFMFPITGTAYVNYTFPLPSNVAGKQIFIRFTDSSSSAGSFADSVFIDYVAVLTHQYGGYVADRTNVVVGSAAGWSCVRAAEIDNDDIDPIVGKDITPEVVAAKNGRWAAFQPLYNQGATPISGFDVSNANMYVYSNDALMANTAPTLFDVTDINGDGFDDILVTNYTAAQSDITQVGYYMNLYPVKVWYLIRELGRDAGSGTITVSVASNLSVN